MNLPHEIDLIILSFLGIKPTLRCKHRTRKNYICRNKAEKNKFFCTLHNGMIESKISKDFFFFNTIATIYSHLWRKQKILTPLQKF